MGRALRDDEELQGVLSQGDQRDITNCSSSVSSSPWASPSTHPPLRPHVEHLEVGNTHLFISGTPAAPAGPARHWDSVKMCVVERGVIHRKESRSQPETPRCTHFKVQGELSDKLQRFFPNAFQVTQPNQFSKLYVINEEINKYCECIRV